MQSELILQGAGEGIVGVDLLGHLTFINPKACSLLGYEANDLIGLNNHLLIHHSYLDGTPYPETKSPVYKTLNDGKVHHGEEIFWRKDGTCFHALISTSPIIQEEKISGAVVTFSNITERKKEEEELRKSEVRLKVIIESTADGILAVDSSGKVLLTNRRFAEMWRIPQTLVDAADDDALLQFVLGQLIDPEEFMSKVRLLYNSTQEDLDELHFKDDRIFERFSAPIQMHDSTLGRVWSFRDITEQRESEKLRNSLYEISDAVHECTDIDALYERIHQIVKKLMHAENFYIALYDPDDDLISFPYFIDELDEPSSPSKPGKGCTEYVLRTGDPIIIDKNISTDLHQRGEIDFVGEPSEVWLGVPLKINSVPIGVMVVQDYKNRHAYGEKEKKILAYVSEQVATAIYKKRTEEQLKRYTEELLELNAAKDKFFSIIAHDLKSPFNSISGFSELLLEQIDQKDFEGIKKNAAIIYQSSIRAMDLLMNLMDWARTQTGKMDFNPTYCKVADFIHDVITFFDDIAGQKSIKISLDIAPGTKVFADKEMVATVLRNLISNAIKFTMPKGEIGFSTRHEQEKVIFAIKDNGVGIPPSAIDKLFRIDENYSTPGTQNEKGTGLGLILCKEFVEKNGGKIWVESEVGMGSTFYFTLPIFKASCKM